MPSEFDNVVYYEAVVELETFTYAREHNLKMMNIAKMMDFEVELDGFGLAKLIDSDHEFQPLRVRKDALLDSLRVAGYQPRRSRIVAVLSLEVF